MKPRQDDLSHYSIEDYQWSPEKVLVPPRHGDSNLADQRQEKRPRNMERNDAGDVLIHERVKAFEVIRNVLRYPI